MSTFCIAFYESYLSMAIHADRETDTRVIPDKAAQIPDTQFYNG
jgi:hypothetical protein